MNWPSGNYAIPQLVYGCPGPAFNEWNNGYLNVSFKNEILLYEKKLGVVGWDNASLLLIGPYGPYSYQLNFCTMTSNNSSTSEARWPSGIYSIFSTDGTCPEGGYNRFSIYSTDATFPRIC